MAWRNHDTHKEETKAVKAALKALGINAKVGHGHGTAWSWLEINLGAGQQFGEHKTDPAVPYRRCDPDYPVCRNLKAMEKKVYGVTGEITGRHGEYDGNTLIMMQDHWNRNKDMSEPITHPNWKTI